MALVAILKFYKYFHSENFNITNESLKKIRGFKGLIDQVVWISTSDIGVITNHGFFIVNLSDNSNAIKFQIAWSHGFYIDVVAVDLEKKTVYVLSLSGQLRSMSFDKNVICETDFMDVVIEKGCLSVQYFADLLN